MFAINTTRRVAVALALCAGLSAIPAFAQHRGGGGDPLIHVMTASKAQLNLNTSQQALWDAAVAAGKAARDAATQRRQSVKQVATEELAKADPNLTRIAATADPVQDANTAARRQVRDQWLAIYNTFSPEQKAVVKTAIASRMSRAEKFRERMHERFGKG